jgi:predicted nucleotidyltransferase
MFSQAESVLKHIEHRLRASYPEYIVSVIVFGSRVRGDHNEDSDFDVLVVVKNRTIEIEEEIMGIFVEEELQSGIYFDPLIKSVESFELEKSHHSPFYQNVMNEGIAV